MMPGVPDHAIRVSESGLYCYSDVERMAAVGADACLIGHALLVSRDPGRKVAELSGGESENQVRIKTCGITNTEDALMAHAAGSHVLGLIFATSPRQIDLSQGQLIRQAVPKARLCGVFVNSSLIDVINTATACDLDWIQLHGDEDPAYCANLATALGVPLVKSFTADDATSGRAAEYTAVSYFLVDLPKNIASPEVTGDTCLTAACELKAAGYDVILAGGLTPETVQAARADAQPFAVDVASGIESRPGQKDPVKTRTFIAEALR